MPPRSSATLCSVVPSEGPRPRGLTMKSPFRHRAKSKPRLQVTYAPEIEGFEHPSYPGDILIPVVWLGVWSRMGFPLAEQPPVALEYKSPSDTMPDGLTVETHETPVLIDFRTPQLSADNANPAREEQRHA